MEPLVATIGVAVVGVVVAVGVCAAGTPDRVSPGVMVPAAIAFAGAVWLVVAVEAAAAAAAAVATAPADIVVAVAGIPKPCTIDTDGIASVVADYETLAAEIFASLPAVAAVFVVMGTVAPVIVAAVLFRQGAGVTGAATSVVAASLAGMTGVWSSHLCDTYMDVATLPASVRYLVDPSCTPPTCPDASVIFGPYVRVIASQCDPKLLPAVAPYLEPGALVDQWDTATTGVCTDIIVGGWWVFAASYIAAAAAVIVGRASIATTSKAPAPGAMQLYTFRVH